MLTQMDYEDNMRKVAHIFRIDQIVEYGAFRLWNGLCNLCRVTPWGSKMLVLFETPAGFALFKVLDEGKLSKLR